MAKKVIEPEVKYAAVCTNCGLLIPENKGLVRENKHYCETCAVLTPVSVKPSLLPPTGFLKILSYMLSLIPIVGFIFGVIFYSQTEPVTKSFGKKCLIIMLVGLLFMFICLILMIVAGVAIGSGNGILNLTEGYY